MIPFLGILGFGVYSTLFVENIEASGFITLTALGLTFLTANRSNSVFSFLLGIPFDRCLLYHKLIGGIATLLAVIHSIAAFAKAGSSSSRYALHGEDSHFGKFLFDGRRNILGTVALAGMLGIIITSLPIVRRRCYEVFYMSHLVVLPVVIVVSCLMWRRYLVPVVAWWVVDIMVRRLIMAGCRYPTTAQIRAHTDDMIEISFAKTNAFEYQAGQYIYLCVPEISYFQWHPFSLSSSPHHDIVTVHIKARGNWTTVLNNLAQAKDSINILIEGPYGSPAVDLDSDRYKLFLLVSGGIGIAPMQSISNSLIHDKKCGRDIKKIWFLWTARDPAIADAIRLRSGCTNTTASVHFEDEFFDPLLDHLDLDRLDEETSFENGALAEGTLHSRSLSQFEGQDLQGFTVQGTGSGDDHDQERNASGGSGEMWDDLSNNAPVLPVGNPHGIGSLHKTDKKFISLVPDFVSNLSVAESTNNSDGGEDGTLSTFHDPSFLRTEFYLTGTPRLADGMNDLSLSHFTKHCRPDIDNVVQEMREIAEEHKETRVALCVCGPRNLIKACEDAAKMYSTSSVRFDVHADTFEY